LNLQILQGDCRLTLPTLPPESVNCIVTSPPYYRLRDYKCAGQIGMEPCWEAYVSELAFAFRQCRRVLKENGTCWVNLGDTYGGLKDLLGIPWRVAFALQADGWFLRQDIIWAKPNPMPESVTDRCTKSHEYLFLLTKSERYWYDQDAIAEAAVYADGCNGSSFIDGRDLTTHPTVSRKPRKSVKRGGFNGKTNAMEGRESFRAIRATRNRRSVWTIPTQPCSMAHFAVMPEALVKPCILAGCPVGGTVLDPFGGSGTVGKVAEELGRNSILCELNPEYIELQKIRTAQQGFSL